jgi:ADP-L-glycero-D-manno-heptose 6-epimerase
MLFDQYAARQSDRGQSPSQWAGLKFFNVYGPNEGHKGGMKSVVAQIWPKVQAGEPVTLFRSHNPDYPDGGQMRDFVFVDDVVDMVDWLLETPAVSGVFNAGSGRARSFLDLAEATFAAAGKEPRVDYVDTPESIRDKYQYFTEARMERLRAAGFAGQATPLEEGVRRYVQDFLATADPYR